MRETRVACRPAIIDPETIDALNREIAAARWVRHRLTDLEIGSRHDGSVGFEGRLRAAAEDIAPGIRRVGRIVARLRGRVSRRRHTTEGQWSPDPRLELCAALVERLAELRRVRDADPRWRTACRWSEDAEEEAPLVVRRRKPSETDDEYSSRVAAGKRRSRRAQSRVDLYSQAWCHADTWNAQVRALDAARAAVIKQRKAGVPAEIHRPRWDDDCTIVSDKAWRILATDGPWWTIEMPVGCARRGHGGVVRFRAKLGSCEIDSATHRRLQLTRRRDGRGWRYSASITVIAEAREYVGRGVVGFDWGHREHGHDSEAHGIRAWVWHGDDGEHGEILIPREARDQLDRAHAEQSRIDVAWDARRRSLGLPHRSRHGYRAALMRSGVQTEEEARWLQWETRIERRCQSARKRAQSLRREAYLSAVRSLRARYDVFALEALSGRHMQALDTGGEAARRKRQNRDLVARYSFVALCERSGATVITVPARNTSRECPDCGHLAEKSGDVLLACTGCGTVRDRDQGAARNILRRGQEALAKRTATPRDHAEAAE